MGLFDIKQLWVAAESAFSTDPSADGSGYTALHAQDIVFTPAQDQIDRPLQNNQLTKIAGVNGAKGGSLTFKLEARGTGTVAGDATQVTTGEAHLPLLSTLGTGSLGYGTKCSAGWTTSTGAVAVAGGINIGEHVLINGEIRRVQNKVTSTLTLDRALSAIPAENDVVYVGANYKPADSGHTSLAFSFKQGGQSWTLLGCKGTMAIEGLSAGGRPLFSFTFQVDNWVEQSKASLPTLNVTTRPKGPVVLGSTLTYGGSTLAISEFSFDLGNEVQAVPSTAGNQGRSDFVVVDRSAAGTIKPLYAVTQVADFVSGSAKTLTMPLGTLGSNAVAVSVASASFSALPTFENVNRQLFLNMPFTVIQSNSSTVPDFVVTVFGL